VAALPPEVAAGLEAARRARLLGGAAAARDETFAELTLAADQFLVVPAARVAATTRARAQGAAMRTVIAGYHWFTDWGRDTMISLEGLALATGRFDEARDVLRTFAGSVRDGLIPNLFPEGEQEGLYHTADATLWLFHAVDRYVSRTRDRRLLAEILPALEEILAAHRRGTRFGIHVDPDDGLLVQGEEGYALTWMDAQCEGWVVTPRRGKAVEVNALYHNALRALERWLHDERGAAAAAGVAAEADRVRESFNRAFWFEAGGHLYDVVGVPGGANDPAFRPNQILAVSLPHPVLDPSRWPAIVNGVAERLLTPVGLRSLAREEREYQTTYHGDVRTRDAAYHQGTVWSWLIGPFVDAWLKVHPGARAEARRFLLGLRDHLGEAGVGQVSEIFDAEPPFSPRGCIAQAWGVAELLRAWRATEADGL
jgi:predicted glycogen debranching enzyme